MKSAMQELKEWVLDTPPSTRHACLDAKIDMLLKSEKQQIVNSWDNGKNMISDIKSGAQYYNQTYNQAVNEKI